MTSDTCGISAGYVAPSGLNMHRVITITGLCPVLSYVAPSGLNTSRAIAVTGLHPVLGYVAPSGLNQVAIIFQNKFLRNILATKWRHIIAKGVALCRTSNALSPEGATYQCGLQNITKPIPGNIDLSGPNQVAIIFQNKFRCNILATKWRHIIAKGVALRWNGKVISPERVTYLCNLQNITNQPLINV